MSRRPFLADLRCDVPRGEHRGDWCPGVGAVGVEHPILAIDQVLQALRVMGRRVRDHRRLNQFARGINLHVVLVAVKGLRIFLGPTSN